MKQKEVGLSRQTHVGEPVQLSPATAENAVQPAQDPTETAVPLQQVTPDKTVSTIEQWAKFLDSLGVLLERIDKVLLRGIATMITLSATVDVVIILIIHIHTTIA